MRLGAFDPVQLIFGPMMLYILRAWPRYTLRQRYFWLSQNIIIAPLYFLSSNSYYYSWVICLKICQVIPIILDHLEIWKKKDAEIIIESIYEVHEESTLSVRKYRLWWMKLKQIFWFKTENTFQEDIAYDRDK